MARLLSLGLLAVTMTLQAAASVTVRKTGKAPTGYEVDFKYINTTASRVTIGGGIQPFTDQFHTTLQKSGLYDPHDYQPGDFYVSARTPADYQWPYEMTPADDGSGVWTYTTPLPSGIYSFAYLVDCDVVALCSIETGKLVIDPDLPPFMNVQGDQVASSFQVPFDAEFVSNIQSSLLPLSARITPIVLPFFFVSVVPAWVYSETCFKNTFT